MTANPALTGETYGHGESIEAAEIIFDRTWLQTLEGVPFVRVLIALAGLPRLGEHPASLERLAVLVDRSLVETAALVQESTSARIHGVAIIWDGPFPGSRHAARCMSVTARFR